MRPGLDPEFFGLTCFGDDIYLSAPDGVHRLVFDGKLHVAEKIPRSEGSRLAASSGKELWLVGTQAIGCTQDGRRWNWLPLDEIVLAQV